MPLDKQGEKKKKERQRAVETPRAEEEEKEVLHGTEADIYLQPLERPAQEQVKSVRRKEQQRTSSGVTSFPIPLHHSGWR